MARSVENIKDINDSRSLWKVAVLVKDLWIVSNSKQMKHVEMVLTDKQGNDIQVIVPTNLKDHFKDALAENTTFTVQNFEVEKNNISLKCSSHPFKLVFNSCTLIQDLNVHKIPMPEYKFTDFADIKQGKARPDVVVDIIGVFHELGYTQTVPGNRKIQINFTLKDLKGETMKCTLWEDFGLQFQNYMNNRTEWGPTIIVIHNGKIKEATENYELGVSNAWNATKLFINADIACINAFKKSLPADQETSSQALSLTCQSQMLSQSSSMSQISGPEKFMQHSSVLPIEQIVMLSQTTVCTTVGRTLKLRPNPKGWYYKACCKCPKAAKGDTLPLICPDGHETHAINLRFKLEFEIEYNKAIGKFIFWDRECNELLGKTAAELVQSLAEDGVTNPLEHPVCFDKICGRTFAFRAKWQPTWDTCSIQALKEDDAIIKKITDLFPNNEETSKIIVGSTSIIDEIKNNPSLDSIETIDLKGDGVGFQTQDLSASSEYDPDNSIAITPAKGKRASASSILSQNAENVDSPTQLSSTKLNKIIKTEKNPI
ncbi:hypothetical protein P8452_09298 [Trifolium repens]|nr:hypothetical protein QL285_052684 [Trifolium repens]WJX19639.1 hypothetical protein P8452_09298 [Trifolium repens]